MASDTIYPQLVFEYPFDDFAVHDAQSRGYLSHAFVEFENGERVSVVFYDPVRLGQDLEVEAAEGRAFIAEPGLIVVPEVTLPNMTNAIESLHAEGFFAAFKSARPAESESSQEMASPPRGRHLGASGHAAAS